MVAAQMYDKIQSGIPDLQDHIREGQFMSVTNWLRKNIHSKGRLLSFNELIKQATGKTLSPAYLTKHIERRYLGAAAA